MIMLDKLLVTLYCLKILLLIVEIIALVFFTYHYLNTLYNNLSSLIIV